MDNYEDFLGEVAANDQSNDRYNKSHDETCHIGHNELHCESGNVRYGESNEDPYNYQDSNRYNDQYNDLYNNKDNNRFDELINNQYNNLNGNQYNEPGYEQDRKSNKKILSRCGWYLSLIIIAISAAQLIILGISGRYFRKFYESDWFDLTLAAIGMLGAGLPLAYILLKKLPDSERGEVKKLSPAELIIYFSICYAAMFYSNLVTIGINFIISVIKGSEVVNPLEDVIFGSNMLIIILYVSILGPIAEELIFRKLLLDKLRRFGDLPAIMITSIAFGLFHMNLSQVLYATAVGTVMAYVTVKTNTIKYSVIIHMILNFIGSGLSGLAINSGNPAVIGLLSLIMYVIVTAGTVFFIVNFRKIRLNKAAMPLVRKRDYILNAGTIVFIVICMIIIVENILVQ